MKHLSNNGLSFLGAHVVWLSYLKGFGLFDFNLFVEKEPPEETAWRPSREDEIQNNICIVR